MILRLEMTVLQFLAKVFGPPSDRDDDENDRGDVPGWVMITIMSAILVVIIIAVFRDNLKNWITNAFNSVNGNSGG